MIDIIPAYAVKLKCFMNPISKVINRDGHDQDRTAESEVLEVISRPGMSSTEELDPHLSVIGSKQL